MISDFCSVLNSTLSHVIKCFAASKLVLNLGKKNIKFVTIRGSLHYVLVIKKCIWKRQYIQNFFVSPINNLNGKNDIEQIIPKLSGKMLCP